MRRGCLLCKGDTAKYVVTLKSIETQTQIPKLDSRRLSLSLHDFNIPIGHMLTAYLLVLFHVS